MFDVHTDSIVKGIWAVENKGKVEDRPLWFIRTKDGGWFSADVDNYMDGCVLDVTGELWDNMVEYYRENCSDNRKQEFEEFVFENTILPEPKQID